MSLLLTLKTFHTFSWCFTVEFRKVLPAGFASRDQSESLSALHLLPLLTPEPLDHRRNVGSLSLFFSYYILVDVHLNWLNWFHFLIFKGGLLAVLIVCMTRLSPFLDVARMSMSTVSFLAQLGSGILCL